VSRPGAATLLSQLFGPEATGADLELQRRHIYGVPSLGPEETGDPDALVERFEAPVEEPSPRQEWARIAKGGRLRIR